MKEITLPKDHEEYVLVLLDGDDVAVDFGRRPLSDLEYRVDYFYGDIVAETTRHSHCVGLSHIRRIPGSSHTEPVFKWEKRYEIHARYRVMRGGKLKKI